ncbi:hypothetical protein KBC70_04045 [Candidatus Woesebacteria bacterium]|nr:hypothetical protein [Candidatus Woesebacteria bacterium]
MNINAPDFTKLNWQFNVALIGATFCVFSLIYNDQYIYLGFLTFLYGIISQAIMPSIEMYFPEKDKWRNFLIGQGFLTMLWIYFSLQSYIEVSFDSKIISTGILFSGLSAISAFAAAIAAISSYKLTKDSRSSEVHKMFLDLMLKYDFTSRNDQDYLKWLL